MTTGQDMKTEGKTKKVKVETKTEEHGMITVVISVQKTEEKMKKVKVETKTEQHGMIPVIIII